MSARIISILIRSDTAAVAAGAVVGIGLCFLLIPAIFAMTSPSHRPAPVPAVTDLDRDGDFWAADSAR